MKTKERYLEDLDWAEAHHSELLKQYRDQWVAIYKGRVIASGESGREAEQEAKQKTGEEAIAMYYVDSGSSIYES